MVTKIGAQESMVKQSQVRRGRSRSQILYINEKLVSSDNRPGIETVCKRNTNENTKTSMKVRLKHFLQFYSCS